MFSTLEHIIKWVAEVTELPCHTYVQENHEPAFCIIERTGGTVDYPHDEPEFTVQIWAETDDEAEAQIMNLATAVKTVPPTDDYHINAVTQAPNVFHFGHDENGMDIWGLSFTMHVNLLDRN